MIFYNKYLKILKYKQKNDYNKNYKKFLINKYYSDDKIMILLDNIKYNYVISFENSYVIFNNKSINNNLCFIILYVNNDKINTICDNFAVDNDNEVYNALLLIYTNLNNYNNNLFLYIFTCPLAYSSNDILIYGNISLTLLQFRNKLKEINKSDNISDFDINLLQSFNFLFFYTQLIKKYPKLLLYIPQYYKFYKKFILDAITDNWVILQYTSEILKGDKDIIKTAINNNGLALQYVCKFQNDKDIVLLAVTNNGLALEFVDELINDKDIVTAAVTNNGLSLEFADDLINDKDIVTTAVTQNGLALQFSINFQNDKDIVMEAVKQNGLALQFASKFQNDTDIVVAAITQNKLALEYASIKLQNNKNIINNKKKIICCFNI